MTYAENFFVERRNTARESAKAMVPWVRELVRPDSIVDVGCGTGSWLAEFRAHGLADVVGLDGDWVPREKLEIPPECFRAHDLCQPPKLGRTFDLVVSLEVGEHLPRERADAFVDTLVTLGPLIFFSAAVPAQGGTGHVNEQWPEFWISRFKQRGYRCFDCVRGRFWNDQRVAFWYAQNVFFFVAEAHVEDYPALAEAQRNHTLAGAAVVHPEMLVRKVNELSDPNSYSLRKFLRVFPRLLKRAVVSRMGRA
ncbi:MAG TPA: class I SAM-dependent methyltransferase [Verrucomicrobiae bacterium]|jgi:SAM-dependent methyltransferase